MLSCLCIVFRFVISWVVVLWCVLLCGFDVFVLCWLMSMMCKWLRLNSCRMLVWLLLLGLLCSMMIGWFCLVLVMVNVIDCVLWCRCWCVGVLGKICMVGDDVD